MASEDLIYNEKVVWDTFMIDSIHLHEMKKNNLKIQQNFSQKRGVKWVKNKFSF